MFHFCFPCLKEVLIKKIVVVKEWVYAITKDKDESHAAEMSYIADVLNHRNDIENICFRCANFILLRLDSVDDFIIV